ncbi:MAG TPA: hypothetical protein VK427_18805, partial [Kofleriaceae bacterium]|nr:hypothetical protein [Kofleriaceae bacterium]
MCWLTFVGCGDGGSDKGDAGTGPACSDGKDNDGDGATDFPDDLSCANASGTSEEGAAAPQCSDGRDNDGDGKTDFPNDPGCFSPQADDERDDCPDGASCAQCGNGRDDDQNGKIDFPDDTGCESAADNSEFQSNPNACGGGLKIKQLPANGMDSGMLDTSSLSQIVSPCGGGMGAPAVAYVVHLPEPKVLVITTDLPGTTADTVVDIRSQMCMDPMSEIACSDNIGMSNNRSALTQSLAAGVYYIIVQGKTAAATGAYALKVERFQGEGTTCTDQANCGPGLLCRVPAGQTGLKCSKPVCKDGLDDDGDTKIDYPNDPGCANADDDTENDTCPGVGCPECGDGIDNDSDSLTDFPADLTCKAAADSSESCTTTEGVISLTAPATMGDTSTATSDLNPTCASSSGSGPDRTYRLDVPALTSLDLNLTASFDTVTVLLNSTCGGTALACSDPLNMHMNALAAGSYYFVVDGWSASSSGTYTINTSGKIANGAACDAHPLAQSGALTCGSGYACKGTAGAKTCQPAECADTVDNNADGKTDFPTDPGCDSASDDTETTVCPGAACPVCSNGIDDDMDNQIDYPADTSCFAASGTSESCASSEAVSVLTTAATMATTVGATNDTKPSCASSSGVAPDLHHQLDLPAMTSLSLSLTGKSPAFWDSVFALYGSSCGGTALSCQEGDTMSLTNLAAGRYYLVVDGWSTGSGAYTVNVSGSIAA